MVQKRVGSRQKCTLTTESKESIGPVGRSKAEGTIPRFRFVKIVEPSSAVDYFRTLVVDDSVARARHELFGGVVRAVLPVEVYVAGAPGR